MISLTPTHELSQHRGKSFPSQSLRKILTQTLHSHCRHTLTDARKHARERAPKKVILEHVELGKVSKSPKSHPSRGHTLSSTSSTTRRGRTLGRKKCARARSIDRRSRPRKGPRHDRTGPRTNQQCEPQRSILGLLDGHTAFLRAALHPSSHIKAHRLWSCGEHNRSFFSLA